MRHLPNAFLKQSSQLAEVTEEISADLRIVERFWVSPVARVIDMKFRTVEVGMLHDYHVIILQWKCSILPYYSRISLMYFLIKQHLNLSS